VCNKKSEGDERNIIAHNMPQQKPPHKQHPPQAGLFCTLRKLDEQKGKKLLPLTCRRSERSFPSANGRMQLLMQQCKSTVLTNKLEKLGVSSREQ
jgi:hypothetical protein